MKKRLAMILFLALLVGIIGAVPALADGVDAPPLPPHIKDGVSVVAIFAAAGVHPIQGPDGAPEDREPVLADAILLFFSDNTFDQYVETPLGYELYSAGTYSFKEDGDFILSEDGNEDILVIEINRQLSMDGRQLAEVSISGEHALGADHLGQLFEPDDGKEVEAVFADDHVAIHRDENDVISHLDAIWVYFTDGTFAEYAFLNDEVVKYGSGAYKLNDAGDFHILPEEEDYGTITQTWEESMGGFTGESLTFDLGTTGLTCLYEKQDADLLAALPTPR